MPNNFSVTDNPRTFNEEAKADFESALRTGFWRSLFSWFTQSRNELLPFDEVRKLVPMKGMHEIGLREIPLDQIVGSVGRYNDFDRVFLPKRTETRSRWISIDTAHLQDVILPPVDVYKIGSFYFVKDGNHRVSVARLKQQAFIDANVIEVDVGVPINTEADIDDLIRLQEKAEFYQCTLLMDLQAKVDIELTLPGGYPKLLEHINVHRWFMGEKSKRPVPYSDAVTHWYDKVYLPLVEAINQQNILHKFPGRTEADLYLWIIEHLWYLREECPECDPSFEQAAVDFTQRFSSRPPLRWSLLQKLRHFLESKLYARKKG
jgi:uncharacterized ParB-like nuclease family protein